MLQLRWHLTHITTNTEANNLIKELRELDGSVVYGAFDTETTGLHIIEDRPFLYQFGYIHPNMTDGYAYSVDIERQPILAAQVIKLWHKFAQKFQYYMGQHIIFDLHMLTNIGVPYPIEDNLTDTMFWIRYGFDAVSVKKGGPPLKLKEFSARYVDSNAKLHEQKLDQEKSLIAKVYNQQLKVLLQDLGPPPEKYKAKSYTLSVLDKIFKDPTIDIDDLEEDFKERYIQWLNNIPLKIRHKMMSGIIEPMDIPYDMLDRNNLITYAQYDIVYTLETFLVCHKLVLARDNIKGVDIENKLIFPLLDMERVGFEVDKQYLEESRIRVKEYIKERRQVLYDITGQEFTIGQHALIKNILYNDFDIDIESTENGELSIKLSELKHDEPDSPAIQVIEVIQELRTLEKWYSTYIIRFLNQLKLSDKLYTSIHQVGAVSGRVTSDFQQFPREAIVDINGNELFHPRKVIRTKHQMVYLDFSQIELRFQAFYTILVGNPDLNLCRAYMPYKCYTWQGNEGHQFAVAFDYKRKDHIKHAYDWAWYLNENPEIRWTPTDVHGATTKLAFDIDESHPDFHKKRYEGKTLNFAKNYGATIKNTRLMFPKYSEEQIIKIDSAYYKAFPGVKKYHEYCYNRAQLYAFTSNLFDIKYYGVSGHNLINQLVQGSAAFYLKMKIREIYDFTKRNKIKAKWQMQIHDELSWEASPEEDFNVFYEFKKIMEDWDDTFIPIVAEMEVTETCWAEKRKGP